MAPWETAGDGTTTWQEIKGLDCLISLEKRPAHCDRGNFLAKISVTGDAIRLSLDGADLWPRFYFDEERAKLEVEAWLEKRGQAL